MFNKIQFEVMGIILLCLFVNVKSSMPSETTKHFQYKCHGLFIAVMITVKSFLKCRSMQ